MKNIIIKLFLLIFIFTMLLGCSNENISDIPENPLPLLEVTILDVGSADAIVITTEEKACIIDTGEKKDGQKILDYLANKNIFEVEYLIITHFDKDHVGGADEVLGGISVKNVLQPAYEKFSTQYNEYINALEEAGVSQTLITENIQFSIGDANFNVFPPKKDDYGEDNDNDFSLVISLKHGASTFLFSGDAMEKRLSELFADGNLKHKFLKVPHHGRYNDKTYDFIAAVDPLYAVITCSEKEPYDKQTKNSLTLNGARVYITTDGDVYAKSDGIELTVTQ